ncbi:hypothetical protein DFH06DRAFT_1312883 [Mycena polygramma]|nr:hypothetical protein DFH06DRAFT_1312883 [Mycena polygramma]
MQGKRLSRAVEEYGKDVAKHKLRDCRKPSQKRFGLPKLGNHKLFNCRRVCTFAAVANSMLIQHGRYEHKFVADKARDTYEIWHTDVMMFLNPMLKFAPTTLISREKTGYRVRRRSTLDSPIDALCVQQEGSGFVQLEIGRAKGPPEYALTPQPTPLALDPINRCLNFINEEDDPPYIVFRFEFGQATTKRHLAPERNIGPQKRRRIDKLQSTKTAKTFGNGAKAAKKPASEFSGVGSLVNELVTSQ